MEDEPAAKKAKVMKKPETKPSRQELHSSRSVDIAPVGQSQLPTAYQHQEPLAYQPMAPPLYQPNLEPAIPESQPQLYQEDIGMLPPTAQAPTTVAPTVSSVSITRRDPRMARNSSGVTVTYTAPEKLTNNTTEPFPSPVIASVEVAPKAPLPMPPALPPSVAVTKSSKTRYFVFLCWQFILYKNYKNMQIIFNWRNGKWYCVQG